MHKVDLNCDMGESFGAYKIGNDEEILKFITSANIACGFHAGDPSVMNRTVKLALERKIAIGAHVGLPDLVGFGRRVMDISSKEAYNMTVYQIGALYGFVKAEGGIMKHVKPHGALYNMAAKDSALSKAIAEAVYKVDPELILFGLSGSKIIEEGEKIGLRVANEVFADRTYTDEGTLTSRKQKNALIKDADKASTQVIRMIKKCKVTSIDGNDIDIKADTICIHGDGTKALEFAKKIKQDIQKQGIKIEAI
ncbi:LamB/YcsF family protein [Clostridium aestuarii]|uniref:5-oxoprolinase subunit A n=1 Tax=Clostridium aestuarii TaxID=338193 RepID=A0ABT4D508_9CLOT|nr:5-oxoprolinase subunit PxpA [Clostridium aestuarii]MCY6485123.1 LamB/YcsF family protein [Clostridium aestuarii]